MLASLVNFLSRVRSLIGEPTSAPRSKVISHQGMTADLPISEDLMFAAALRLLLADRDYRSIRIGIDPATFYSESPAELHDFVDAIQYRFVTEEGSPFLAYDVSNRHGGIYREVAYDGTVLREWPLHVIHIGFPGEQEVLRERAARMKFTLGRL